MIGNSYKVLDTLSNIQNKSYFLFINNYYRIRFAPAKYELVHFTRARNRFNLAATIQLGQGAECVLLPSVRVLGVWLDTKLNWKVYTKVV
jgi:hypothetical protein